MENITIPRPPLIFPLVQRPEWRSDSRAITFLKTNYEWQLATKQWVAGIRDPIAYPRVAWWQPFVALANNIEDLSAVLLRAAEFPRLAAIRGAVREGSVLKDLVNRRVYPRPGKLPPDIEDVPRHWLMIDLDSLPEPEAFDWRTDLRGAAIWAARRYLPSAFQNSAFHYHYSGSAGIEPGLRLHYWFWLDEAMKSAEIKRYLECVGDGKLDLRLYNPVQPHYTADPIFIGLNNPLIERRGGLILEFE